MAAHDPFRRRSERQAIDARAAAFVASAAHPRHDEELARWIAADPAHAVAYVEAEMAWDSAARLRADPPPLRADNDRPSSSEDGAAARGMSRRAVAAGIVAAGVAGGGGLLAWARADRGIYDTAVGERRTIRLADGSIVGLNTESRIQVIFGDARRTIRLIRGEALFTVAHDAARPFVVDVASGWIRAIGTAFNVRVRRELVELTVTEGVVTLGSRRHSPDDDGHPRVSAGSGAVLRPDAVAETRLDESVIRQRVAWRQGVIDLDGNTVDQAVEEFNRYRTDPIVIGDPRIASIRVGGRFETGEADKFLAALEFTLPIRSVKGGDGSVMLLYAD